MSSMSQSNIISNQSIQPEAQSGDGIGRDSLLDFLEVDNEPLLNVAVNEQNILSEFVMDHADSTPRDSGRRLSFGRTTPRTSFSESVSLRRIRPSSAQSHTCPPKELSDDSNMQTTDVASESSQIAVAGLPSTAETQPPKLLLSQDSNLQAEDETSNIPQTGVTVTMAVAETRPPPQGSNIHESDVTSKSPQNVAADPVTQAEFQDKSDETNNSPQNVVANPVTQAEHDSSMQFSSQDLNMQSKDMKVQNPQLVVDDQESRVTTHPPRSLSPEDPSVQGVDVTSKGSQIVVAAPVSLLRMRVPGCALPDSSMYDDPLMSDRSRQGDHYIGVKFSARQR